MLWTRTPAPAYAVFSPQECSSVRHADIRLHEKSRDTLAAMGTVAACGQPYD